MAVSPTCQAVLRAGILVEVIYRDIIRFLSPGFLMSRFLPCARGLDPIVLSASDQRDPLAAGTGDVINI